MSWKKSVRFEAELQIWQRSVSSRNEYSNHGSDKHPQSGNINVHGLDPQSDFFIVWTNSSRVYLLLRQKVSFNQGPLVQFKVRWTVVFLKCHKLFLYLFETNSLQKRDYRGNRQKQLNFKCRSLVQFKVTWKLWFFWNIKIHSKNVATEALKFVQTKLIIL